MPPQSEARPFLPDRVDTEEVVRLARRSLSNPILQAVLESSSGYVMVLNESRQILACNMELQDALPATEPPGHIGELPGEALGCVHTGEGPGGCGSSAACAGCGAFLAILESQSSRSAVSMECSLVLRRDGHLIASDFLVKASCLTLGCHELTVVMFQDITARKRQKLLESIFLHDLANTLQSLIGWGELVADGASDPRRAARRIVELCHRLRHEVSQQRVLHEAEQGSLEVCMEVLPLQEIVEELRDLFLGRPIKDGPRLAIAGAGAGVMIRTDKDLLLRVLQNMVANALEATPAEGTVSVDSEAAGQRIRIRVTNPGVVPEGIASRIFHRSVTTKGPGRGLGTYGMKLIGEDYLGGTLTFHSGAEEGTCFTLELQQADEGGSG